LVYGELIRQIRKEKGITLKKLADLSRLSYQYLSNVERGEVNTPIETLATIFDALGVSMAGLGGASVDPLSTSPAASSGLVSAWWRIPCGPWSRVCPPLGFSPAFACAS
jgi:transcriptional regulator with XRE-family HTH domain